MLFAFLSAYIPVDFTIDGEGGNVSVVKVGFTCSYAQIGAPSNYFDFQFGWMNVLMICCCIFVGIFMIVTIYLNFFQAKKTIMNRYAYIICACIIIALILENIFGQLAGKMNPDAVGPGGTNFFPIFFSTVETAPGSDVYLYRWNEAGIGMLVVNVLIYIVIVVMIPFWIVVAVKTGRMNRYTGRIMMMQDDHMKAMIAKQVILEKKAQE